MLLTRARGLFIQAGYAETPLQLSQDIIRLQSRLRKHNQRVKPQVGGLVNDFGTLTGFSGEHRFSRFLANLLENRVQSLGIQPRDVGALRIGPFA